MRKSLFILFAAAVVASVACKQEIEPNVIEDVTDGPVRFEIKMPQPETSGATKVTLLPDFSIVWSEGDEIVFDCLNAGVNDQVICHLVEGAGTTSGIFECKHIFAGEYEVGYPSSFTVYQIWDPTKRPWPRQYYDGRKLTGAPMNARVCVDENNVIPTFELKNVGGVLNFRIKGTEKVGSITLKSESPELDIFLDCGEGVQLTPEGTDFFLSVRPGTFTSACLNVQMVDGNYCEYRTDTLTIKQNVVSVAELTPVFSKFHTSSVESFVPGDSEISSASAPGFKWFDDDLIAINDVQYKAVPMASDSLYAGFRKADASKTKPGAPYRAFYPSDIVVDFSGELDYKMPQTQCYYPDRIEQPMMAVNSGDGFDFKNLCGVICTRLTGNTAIKKITISAVNKSERLSGFCSIDDDGNITFKGGTQSLNTTSLNFDRQYPTGGTFHTDDLEYYLPYYEATDFYICIPPGTYSEGLNIKVTRSDGGAVEKTISGPLTIERNKVYTYTMDVPSAHSKFETAVYKGQEISVRCTQLWSGGPYWADCNIGTNISIDYYGDTFSWGGKIEGNREDYYQGSGSLGAQNNTAYYLWGDNWRMPSAGEFERLHGKCCSYPGKQYLGATGEGDYQYDIIYFHCGNMYNRFFWTTDPSYERHKAYIYKAYKGTGGVVELSGGMDSFWEPKAVRPVRDK